ncbi:MAG: hypothetical protein OXS28_00670 [Gammaproteobacteria bacterium]|nr:hypothetical protein [Gammaproteobacteria bacterium]MDE0283494.1 hypothetical protein [Gammaproteobacteria bacterium]
MTEINEQDWVSLRARCTVQHRFDELKETLMADVSKFNNLHEKYIGKRRFYADDDTDMQLQIFRGYVVHDTDGSRVVEKRPDYENDPDHRIEITVEDESFVVRQGQIMDVRIGTRWNADSLSCDYLVDDQVVSLIWISQRVPGDFMFQHLDGDAR